MGNQSAPWMKFYPSDWRADQALRICSLAARGLWIECMCIMHEADPYGHLVINGRPVTDTQLSALTGAPVDQLAALLTELEDSGVFSRNGGGVIYSRRMTRDEKKARTARNNGKNGGNPSLCNTKPNPPSDKGRVKAGVKGEDKPQMPDARLQSSDSQSRSKSESKNTESESHPNNCSSADERRTIDRKIDFDEWWACWSIVGTKRSVAKARPIYLRLVSSGKVSHERLCAGVRAYMDWCEAQPQPVSKIKHPTTWLGGGCWDDELVVDQPKGNANGRDHVFNAARSILERDKTRGYVDDREPVAGDQAYGGPGKRQGGDLVALVRPAEVRTDPKDQESLELFDQIRGVVAGHRKP